LTSFQDFGATRPVTEESRRIVTREKHALSQLRYCYFLLKSFSLYWYLLLKSFFSVLLFLTKIILTVLIFITEIVFFCTVISYWNHSHCTDIYYWNRFFLYWYFLLKSFLL
jgi:hypothetical protein